MTDRVRVRVTGRVRVKGEGEGVPVEEDRAVVGKVEVAPVHLQPRAVHAAVVAVGHARLAGASARAGVRG